MPHVRTVETTVFKFDELSDSAKEKARDWWRDCENYDFDSECIYDNAVECGRLMGIDIDTHGVKLMNNTTRQAPTIYYSGFSSQGDGACFEGHYSYAKGGAKAIRQHAPTDTELHRIADELQVLQRANFYRLTASMRHPGHYYHSGCMEVSVDDSETRREGWLRVEESVTQLMRDFADWIYKQLESEYEYRMLDENVDESIRCNEYEFDENGTIA